MIKKIVYWCVFGVVILALISFFIENGVSSLIQGISTGFSVAIGSIIANEYVHKRGKKLVKNTIKNRKV